MVKMETSAVDTSFNLKGAFEQATQGGVTAGGNLDAKYKNIISNASFTALALGGGAETPVSIFSGGAEAALKGLQDYIKQDARYRRDNPGFPVAYTVVFLKDNEFARMGFTTDYTDTECVNIPTALSNYSIRAHMSRNSKWIGSSPMLMATTTKTEAGNRAIKPLATPTRSICPAMRRV